jgi:hypothetical protein
MRAGFNKNLSALEQERHEGSLAMVPTTPAAPPKIYGYIRGAATGTYYPVYGAEHAAYRRRNQRRFVQQSIAPVVDPLMAWKARFVDYLFRNQQALAPAVPTETAAETENKLRIVPGVTLEKDRLHHRWLGKDCWCGGRCAKGG